jgi:hypothetical protein
MDAASVRELFREAIAHNDASAMREGLERMLGLAEGQGLSPDDEYKLRAPDFVMEMPQSRERIRGRDAMRSMQAAFPTPPQSMKIRRVVGADRLWVLEGELDYGEGPWCAAVIFELDDDASILRETRYYTERSEAPAWRSAWVEAME